MSLDETEAELRSLLAVVCGIDLKIFAHNVERPQVVSPCRNSNESRRPGVCTWCTFFHARCGLWAYRENYGKHLHDSEMLGQSCFDGMFTSQSLCQGGQRCGREQGEGNQLHFYPDDQDPRTTFKIMSNLWLLVSQKLLATNYLRVPVRNYGGRRHRACKLVEVLLGI